MMKRRKLKQREADERQRRAMQLLKNARSWRSPVEMEVHEKELREAFERYDAVKESR